MRRTLLLLFISVFLLGLTACAAAPEAPAPAENTEAPPAVTETPEKAPQVLISEVMPLNTSTLISENEKFSPWVELYNAGGETAVLEGYTLDGGGESLPLPPLQIAPGDYALLFCEEADFSLSAGGGSLRLVSGRGTVLDSLSYPALEADQSACREEDGQMLPAWLATPGYANSAEGYAAFQSALVCQSPLQINEVMVYNEWVLPIGDGEYTDWIELKNVSDRTIELSDYYLADNGSARYRLSAGTLAPGERTIVYCLEDETKGIEGAPFGLGTKSDRLVLSDAEGRVLDYACLRQIPLGGSYGRMEGENGFFYFASPTPGWENAGGARSVARKPQLMGRDGIFNDVESLSVVLEAEGEIYYTTDGSEPSAAGRLYTGPIELTSTTVLRAVSVCPGQLNSESLDLSFLINENHVLPVLSLVTDPANLFGDSGIYSNPLEDWEKPSTIMFYEEDGGFSIACGAKMHGATSRFAQQKKSFKLNFRSRYGGELNYDLFSNGVTEFSSIVLRADQEDHFSTFMRDNIMHQLAIRCFPELPAQDYRSAVLYLNGEYWGIYNIREAHSAAHYANHYGYDESTVIHTQQRWSSDGTPSMIYSFATNNDMRKDENYEYVAQHLNIDSVIAWCIIEAYSGNFDMHSPNMRFYYSYEDDMLRYALVDLDLGMFSHHGFEAPFGFGYAYNKLAAALNSNAKYREKFLTTLSEALKGPMSDENVLALIDSLADELRPEIPRNCERWDNTPEVWERMVNGLRSFITNGNGMEKFMVGAICQQFPVSAEEREFYFGDIINS